MPSKVLSSILSILGYSVVFKNFKYIATVANAAGANSQDTSTIYV